MSNSSIRFGIWALVHGSRAALQDPDEPYDASWERNRSLVLKAEALGYDSTLVAQQAAAEAAKLSGKSPIEFPQHVALIEMICGYKSWRQKAGNGPHLSLHIHVVDGIPISLLTAERVDILRLLNDTAISFWVDLTAPLPPDPPEPPGTVIVLCEGPGPGLLGPPFA